MLAGNSLTLTASEDITNRSGEIGGNDVTLTAGGDIVNETIFSHLFDNGHNYTALGAFGGPSVNFFGAAFNVYTGDDLLAQLQNRSFYPEADHSSMSLHYQNHKYDPVGRLPVVGNNPSTGGAIPEGESAVVESVKALLGKPDTTHNCYGNIGLRPDCGAFWPARSVLVPVVPRRD